MDLETRGLPVRKSAASAWGVGSNKKALGDGIQYVAILPIKRGAGWAGDRVAGYAFGGA